MLKGLLMSYLICLVAAASSQNAIPNYLFEDWERIDTFAWQKPVKWNCQYALDLIKQGDTPQFKRSEINRAGTYSLLIEPKQASDGKIYGENFSQNFGLKGQPSSLNGYYKMDGWGNAFTISVILYMKDSLQQNYIELANGSITNQDTTTLWKEFTIPVQYNQNTLCERCSITISFPANQSPSLGSKLWLDALSFKGKSIGFDEVAPQISFNPNEENLYIHGIENGKAMITNMSGRNIYMGEIKAGQYISTQNLSTGIYIFSIQSLHQTYTYKFIII
jgi:hypothetical protein